MPDDANVGEGSMGGDGDSTCGILAPHIQSSTPVTTGNTLTFWSALGLEPTVKVFRQVHGAFFTPILLCHLQRPVVTTLHWRVPSM
jgi:hypothetical protein